MSSSLDIGAGSSVFSRNIAPDSSIEIFDHNPVIPASPPRDNTKSWLGRKIDVLKDLIKNPTIIKLVLVSLPIIVGTAILISAVAMTGICIAFPPLAPILVIPIVGASLIGLAVTGVGAVIFMVGLQIIDGKDDTKYYPDKPSGSPQPDAQRNLRRLREVSEEQSESLREESSADA